MDIPSKCSLIRILSKDDQLKSVAVLAEIIGSPGEYAVVIAHKSAFSNDLGILQTDLLCSRQFDQQPCLLEHNDIYYQYTLKDPNAESPAATVSVAAKLTIIYPATPAHIKKYTSQPRVMVKETPQLYQAITGPYFDSIPRSRIRWVDNILDGTSESEACLWRDDPTNLETGFILLPDSKWDQSDRNGMYLLALPLRKDLRSIRDLGPAHLPLLRHMYQKIPLVVMDRYGHHSPQLDQMEADQREKAQRFQTSGHLRMFLHYLPSYPHLHVHVTWIGQQIGGIAVGQAHLLSTVIDNIANVSADYYQRCSLAIQVGSEHELFEKFSMGQ